jgi:hypothetical protein
MHTPRLSCLFILAAAAACGDDGPAQTTTTTTPLTTGLTPGPVTDSNDAAPTSTGDSSGVTGNEGGNTDALTSTTANTTTSSTGHASSSEGGESTGSTTAVSATATTSGESTQACVCTPGETDGCDPGGGVLVCADDCLGYAPEPCAPGQSCKDGVCSAGVCSPGFKQCVDPDSYEQCNGEGSGYDPPVACAPEEGCFGGVCTNLCSVAEATPSSVGCSFFGARQDNYDYADIDSLVVGNTSKTKTAKVQLYFTADGTNVEAPQGAAVDVMPGKTAEFKMNNQPFKKVSGLRKGGVYRVQSSIPVVAYQHSPIKAQATNDSSMLLPEHALKMDHVIASYRDTVDGEDRPSYFNVIATADGTTVKWTPPVATVAGVGVPAVAANTTGMVVMNRFDMLQVRVANDQDISGALVSADKPVWVVGGVNCAFIPANQFACDHCEEAILPLDYWGKEYVGAHSPKRGSEKHYWRIYGGEDGTVVTATPAVPGSPVNVNKGQWKELVLNNSVSTIFTSDKPFLAVQYLESQFGGAGTGDPAMYQMIPVEQFLDSYTFVTGVGYTNHYVQVIRAKGNPDVLVDGAVVGGYYAVGDYEVSDWVIGEGSHTAESAAPFGIVSVGYTGVTSYAYPGGLKLEVINPQ